MIERLRVTRLEAVVGGAALVLAVAAFWLTVRRGLPGASRLARGPEGRPHPGPGPRSASIGAGAGPRSRFGPLLIVAGFLRAPYILQSSADAVGVRLRGRSGRA